MAMNQGLCAFSAAAAYMRQPGSPALSGEYGQPWPTSWLMPCRKCRSASAFMSSGVARNAGEWSQVQVSDEMTCRWKRCPAEAAQRVSENSLHMLYVALPSPSIKSARRLLKSVTGGNP